MPQGFSHLYLISDDAYHSIARSRSSINRLWMSLEVLNKYGEESLSLKLISLLPSAFQSIHH